MVFGILYSNIVAMYNYIYRYILFYAPMLLSS